MTIGSDKSKLLKTGLSALHNRRIIEVTSCLSMLLIVIEHGRLPHAMPAMLPPLFIKSKQETCFIPVQYSQHIMQYVGV